MFWHRLGSMIVLLGLLALTLWVSFCGKMAYLVLAVFLIVFLTKELGDMLGNIDIKVWKKELMWINFIVFIASAFTLLKLDHYFDDPADTEKILYTLYAVLPALIFLYFSILFVKSVNDQEKLKGLIGTVFIFVFVTVPVLLITYIYTKKVSFSSNSINTVFLYFILVTKSGDIGAYVIGSLSNKLLPGGNHKLIPSVSPGKSFEGVLGGIALSVAVSFVINHFFPVFRYDTLPFVIGSGIVLYFAGMYGDLVESAIKRTCKVKDSGRIIPGIGGVYDLVDSLFLSAPFMFAIISLYEYLHRSL